MNVLTFWHQTMLKWQNMSKQLQTWQQLLLKRAFVIKLVPLALKKAIKTYSMTVIWVNVILRFLPLSLHVLTHLMLCVPDSAFGLALHPRQLFFLIFSPVWSPLSSLPWTQLTCFLSQATEFMDINNWRQQEKKILPLHLLARRTRVCVSRPCGPKQNTSNERCVCVRSGRDLLMWTWLHSLLGWSGSGVWSMPQSQSARPVIDGLSGRSVPEVLCDPGEAAR